MSKASTEKTSADDTRDDGPVRRADIAASRLVLIHGRRVVVARLARILWGEAREYPQEILLRHGAKTAGLFHLRFT